MMNFMIDEIYNFDFKGAKNDYIGYIGVAGEIFERLTLLQVPERDLNLGSE